MLNDEVSAHFAEDVLSNRHTLEKLIEAEPTLKDRILSFFKGASEDYKSVPRLSGAARSYYKTYKKLFDEFSARNAQNNSTDNAHLSAVSAKKAQKKPLTSTNEENVQVAEEMRFALSYDSAIDQIDNGTFDSERNTHLRVLEHTPQIYIDKAGAADREIVMSWDIAYLAMRKSGDISGNYHGLGAEIMKALPHALEDPLYIVKQKNGRIAAVTKIVVKSKRAVFASIELETYQTTIQEGETEAKKYNLVVTVTDAKPNYLKNTIFSGEIVHNKNSEDPAHFILRLKSLEKAVPTYDPAGSSNSSITDNAPKSNTFEENSSEKFSGERFALSDSGAERVTVSKGALQKQKANYTSDKVYSKKDVVAADLVKSFDVVMPHNKFVNATIYKIQREFPSELPIF